MRTVFALFLVVLISGKTLGYEDSSYRKGGAFLRLQDVVEKLQKEKEEILGMLQDNSKTIAELQTMREEDRAKITQLQEEVDILHKSVEVYQACRQLRDFDGKSVSAYTLTTQKGLANGPMCNQLCNEDSKCRSYRYNSAAGACSTYAVMYSAEANALGTVSSDSGSKLYMRCSESSVFGSSCRSSSDCAFDASTCTNGMCECELGYSYDPNTGECTKYCSHYGDYFAMSEDKGVYGCNIRSGTVSSGRACAEWCRTESSINCINAEFQRSSGRCYLCHTSWYGLSSSSRAYNDPGWDLYHRHCAL